MCTLFGDDGQAERQRGLLPWRAFCRCRLVVAACLGSAAAPGPTSLTHSYPPPLRVSPHRYDTIQGAHSAVWTKWSEQHTSATQAYSHKADLRFAAELCGKEVLPHRLKERAPNPLRSAMMPQREAESCNGTHQCRVSNGIYCPRGVTPKTFVDSDACGPDDACLLYTFAADNSWPSLPWELLVAPPSADQRHAGFGADTIVLQLSEAARSLAMINGVGKLREAASQQRREWPTSSTRFLFFEPSHCEGPFCAPRHSPSQRREIRRAAKAAGVVVIPLLNATVNGVEGGYLHHELENKLHYLDSGRVFLAQMTLQALGWLDAAERQADERAL